MAIHTPKARHHRHTARMAGGFLAALASGALLTPAALAQMFSVPRNGVADDWVDRLEIPLESDWEWIETLEDRVFFATRMESTRSGDQVTMWMRVEYRDPQPAGKHRSVAEKDEWDCRTRKRSTLATALYRWNNLQDNEPNRSVAALRVWTDIPRDTVGDSLLEFACNIHPTSTLVAPPTPGTTPPKPATKPAAPMKKNGG
jgi:hypothetical protein